MSNLERPFSARRDLETDDLLNDLDSLDELDIDDLETDELDTDELDSTDFARVTVDPEWSSDSSSLTPHLTEDGS